MSIVKKCIKNSTECIGRDSREITAINGAKVCCLEEIQSEKDIAQNIVDSIEDCRRDKDSLLRVSSKLSFAAHTINHNEEEELLTVLPTTKRFSLLLYEFQDKIVHDQTIGDLTCSFVHELQKWFSYRFLEETSSFEHPAHYKSIVADINTVEMALGVCMLETPESCLDDLFF